MSVRHRWHKRAGTTLAVCSTCYATRVKVGWTVDSMAAHTWLYRARGERGWYEQAPAKCYRVPRISREAR